MTHVAGEASRATTHRLNYGPLLASSARCCSHGFIYFPILPISWLTFYIEYDNDPEDPEKQFRSAHESTIFAHLRRIPPLPPQRRKSVDYLNVQLPGDDSAGSKTESGLEPIARHNSGDSLRNPFGRDTVFSDGGGLAEEEGEIDVDLASWGLASFIPKDKGGASLKNKGKEKVTALPKPHATTQASYRSTRSLSMGNIDSFGTLDPPSTVVPDYAR